MRMDAYSKFSRSIGLAIACAVVTPSTACTRTVDLPDADAATPLDSDDVAPIDAPSIDASRPDVLDDDTSLPDVPPFDAGPPCPTCAPRAISPAPATVTSLAPTFEWVPPPAADRVRVEVCADRNCATSEWTNELSAHSVVPTTPLTPGVHFWRLTAHDATGWQTTPSPPWNFVAETRVTRRASSCAQRSDFDGDGRTDLAAGMPVISGRGHVSIYLGTATGFPSAPDTTIDAPTPDPHFATTVLSIGDFNGDGFGDLLANGWEFAPTGPTYLFLGGPLGLATTPSVAWSDPSGSAGTQYALWSDSPHGDFNGDGYADVLLSAAADGATDAAYVYYGRPSAFSTLPDVTLHDPGSTPMSQFGRCTAGVGDINGDGFDDAAVGATAGAPGRVYLYYGSASGIGASPSVTIADPIGGDLGCPIVAAGDVDADGYADFLATGMRDFNGTVFVIRGGTGALAATRLQTPSTAGGGPFGFLTACLGDVNGDSFDDIGVPGAVLTSTSQTGALFVYQGSASGLRTTPAMTLLAPAGSPAWFNAARFLGDLDADGFDDIAVGAERLDTGPDGMLFIYRGSAMGLVTMPAATLLGPPRSLIGASLAQWVPIGLLPSG